MTPLLKWGYVILIISEVTIIFNGIFSEGKGHTWQNLSTGLGSIQQKMLAENNHSNFLNVKTFLQFSF